MTLRGSPASIFTLYSRVHCNSNPPADYKHEERQKTGLSSAHHKANKVDLWVSKPILRFLALLV